MSRLTFLSVLLCCFLIFECLIVSCSSYDEDVKDITNNSLQQISGKYLLDDNVDGFKSIELLPSGTYIVSFSYHDAATSYVLTRLTTNNQYIIGNYSMINNLSYMLDGFGLLKVEQTDNIPTAFVLTLDNGNEVTLGIVSQLQEYVSTTTTNNLCREWNVTSLEEKYYLSQELIYHIKYTVGKSDFDILFDPYGYYTEKSSTFIQRYSEQGPCSVIFSKVGTYGVQSNNGYFTFSKWWWKDEADGQIYYSSYDAAEDYEEPSYVTLQFSDKQLITTEFSALRHPNPIMSRLILCESIITLKSND